MRLRYDHGRDWDGAQASQAGRDRRHRAAIRRRQGRQSRPRLRQVEVLVGQGKPVAEDVRTIGVTEATYCRWRAEHGGLKLDQVKRLSAQAIMFL